MSRICDGRAGSCGGDPACPVACPVSGGPEVRPSERQQLAEALLADGHSLRFGPDGYELDGVMRAVDRIAAQRATEALQAAARSPVRQAAAVLSDHELGDALDLWYQQREEGSA